MITNKEHVAIALACLVLSLYGCGVLFPLPYGSFGTIDFLQYWHSWNILLEGKNPYDPNLATSHEHGLAHLPKSRFLAWNPPWTFTLLSPFTSGTFETAVMFWMLMQFVLLAVIGIVTPTALEKPRPNVWLSGITLVVFFPVLNSLYFGQLGVLLATSIALFLSFQQRGLFFWAGLSLLPLSVKPHLFLLFVVPGIKWMLQLPRSHVLQFLCGAAGGLAALLAITCTFNPHILSDWTQVLRANYQGTPVEGTIPFPLWQTTTIATWIRLFLSPNHLALWPLQIVPLTALMGTIIYFSISKRPIIWRDVVPPLLCVSLLTSSYGWVYDQSVLIITQIAIVCGALELRQRIATFTFLAVAFSLQLLSIFLSDKPQHYFVWLPIAVLILFYAERTMLLSQRAQKHAYTAD